MKTSVILADQISHYESAINSHLRAVFCAPINVEINDEFVCAVIIENKGNRITSYNVCYTKLLRTNEPRSKTSYAGSC